MMPSELVSGVVLGVVEGAVLYVIDCRLGVRAYRWWYDLTHREPLPADVEQGFIMNRKANARFTVATLVALAQNGTALGVGIVEPFLAMLTIALEVPVLMGGFYLGPALRRLWQRKDPLLAVVDQIESGETSIGAEVKRATTRVADAFRREDAAASEAGPRPGPAAALDEPLEAPPLPPAEPPVPPPVPEPDPVEALRRFTKRQQ